jgi:integrase
MLNKWRKGVPDAGAALVIPIHAKLHTALKAVPAKGIHLIGDQHGRPMARVALTKLMKQAAKLAGLGPECVPHGLRKAILRRLAERGGSANEISTVSDYRSLREVERRTAAADQRCLFSSAVDKLSDE